MKKIQINQDYLKIFALIAMTLDHIGEIFLPEPFSLYVRGTIGRTVFPIFAFLIMFHLFQKKCFMKYMERLFFFAIITQIVLHPFLNGILNIFFTLLLPIVFLFLCDETDRLFKKKSGRVTIKIILLLVFVVASVFVQYNTAGFLLMVGLYEYFKTHNFVVLGFVLLCSFLTNWAPGEHLLYGISSLLTMIFLFFVGFSKYTKRVLKKWWIFYAYFPIHLFMLHVLKLFLTKGAG